MSPGVSQAVGNRRLLKLAAFLRTLPRNRFNYGLWVGYDWKGAQDLSCGTTACALGWAATMPAFRRIGLRLEKRALAGGYGGGRVTLAKPNRLTSTNDASITAAEQVFGLTGEEALFLFVPSEFLDNEQAPSREATPKQVAAHIERFVKSRRVNAKAA